MSAIDNEELTPIQMATESGRFAPTTPGKNDDGRLAHVIRIALPLVVASSGHALRLYYDRKMLSVFDADHFKASLSAGLSHFTMVCFFMGVVSYACTFVAQYTGSKQMNRVGPSVWQAIYLALLGGLAIVGINLCAEPFFAWCDHEAQVQPLEVTYFSTLNLAAILPLTITAISAFWNGRGKTWTIVLIEIPMAGLNILLNYLLIFGNFGFPRWGIFGAAIATNLSSLFGCAIAIFLFLRRRNRQEFDTFPKKTFEWGLFKRLLRFGIPNGVHFFLDLAAFNFFINILGRLGPLEHEASTIAFSVNGLTFIPMLGLGMAINVLVGQAIGARNILQAKQVVRSGLYLVWGYGAAMLLLFIFASNIFLDSFVRPGDAAQAEVLEAARILLQYVAAYLLFDGTWIVLNSALKGAGDTKVTMWIGLGMAWLVFAGPSYLMWHYQASMWSMWKLLLGYVILAAFVFYIRYRSGKWQSMRVVE